MSSITVAQPLVDLLRQAKDLTEIRDASGNTLGFFAPATTSQDTCFTTKQVFERLLSLTKDEKMRAYLERKIEVVGERDACVTP